MADHHTQTVADAPIDDVVALLEARPATWLVGFLILATSLADATSARREVRPWYRLGEPRVAADGSHCSSLIWWPHVDGATFTRFRGQICAAPEGAATRLTVQGTTEGGDDEVAERALTRLVELLAAALGADQARGG